MRHARRRNRASVSLVAIIASVAVAAPAIAATRAVTAASPRTSSASWGVAAGPVGAAPTVGAPFVLRWVPPISPQYFTLTNTGSLSLLSTTYAARNNPPANGVAPPEVAFDACVGASWSRTLNTCAGTVVRIGSTSGGAFTVTSTTTPSTAGSTLSVRAAPISLLNFPNEYSTTLNITVTRAQARAASTTHR